MFDENYPSHPSFDPVCVRGAKVQQRGPINFPFWRTNALATIVTSLEWLLPCPKKPSKATKAFATSSSNPLWSPCIGNGFLLPY